MLSNATKSLPTTANLPNEQLNSSGKKVTCKVCFACPERNMRHDDCIVENGEVNCQELIEVRKESSVPPRQLSEYELQKLAQHDTRSVSDFKRLTLEKDLAKNWDRFYMRNQDKFFKDRHWISREFEELRRTNVDGTETKTLLEIGCGCGNLVLPLLADDPHLFVFACDFSPTAVKLLKCDAACDFGRCSAFVCDVTSQDLSSHIPGLVDYATLIFVLSAINPEKMLLTLQNIRKVIRPGGKLLFRDYGLYDHAMIRFSAGHKLADNFYFRQDGTYSYYFSTDEIARLATEAGFVVETCTYCFRETVNKKEEINVPRIFVQGKFVVDA